MSDLLGLLRQGSVKTEICSKLDEMRAKPTAGIRSLMMIKQVPIFAGANEL